ncbi:MAG: 5-formyltetrahydrofolate cyclo-ligase [Pseudomonadota bacterium]
MIDKRQLRKQIRQQRQALTPQQRRDAARDLASLIGMTPAFRRARKIAGYVACAGEMDLQAVITQAWRHSKRFYLPILHAPVFNRMWFAPYAPGDKLTANRYGIPEPHGLRASAPEVLGLDVVFVPLVAFDLCGNRLGMGGGYYDRTFEYLLRRKVWRKPLLIGVAYEFQQVSQLPREPWDVPLCGVITEKQAYWF